MRFAPTGTNLSPRSKHYVERECTAVPREWLPARRHMQRRAGTRLNRDIDGLRNRYEARALPSGDAELHAVSSDEPIVIGADRDHVVDRRTGCDRLRGRIGAAMARRQEAVVDERLGTSGVDVDELDVEVRIFGAERGPKM